jgi:hypothetical protein
VHQDGGSAIGRKYIAKGHLYELGRFDNSLPFAQLEKLSRVNERAQLADKDPSFSQRIGKGCRYHPCS